MADKTNKSNNSNSIQITKPNQDDILCQLGEPVSPRIIAKESQNLSSKMLHSAISKQQNAPIVNTNSSSSIQSKIDNILSLIFKGK